MFAPRVYISCPCAQTFNALNVPSKWETENVQTGTEEAEGQQSQSQQEIEEEEDEFDPKAPRSNYSLFPLDQLLYCEDCHQIRCPRCILEEIVCFYCPNCLFEVPGSLVQSEARRCTRNCFGCPVCTAPLSVSGLETGEGGSGESLLPGGPWVLSCSHCNWSSAESGMVFDKPNNIVGQLAKIKGQDKAGITPAPTPERGSLRKNGVDNEHTTDTPPVDPQDLSHDKQFTNLKEFYLSQLSDQNNEGPLGGSYGYGSPGNLSRIMGMYTGISSQARKKAENRTGSMREASRTSDGLKVSQSEEGVIRRMATGWQEMAGLSQKSDLNINARFAEDLQPLTTVLRTKRSKRCRACRHILVRPESKVQSTRFRIKLLAQNYIPSLAIRPLSSPSSTSVPSLKPLSPSQFILKFTNPLYDPIKLTLATPSTTPGRLKSKVTILCPQFEIGANADVWDEALSAPTPTNQGSTTAAGSQQPEAGKVWDKGRNWTSVIVEVVPASIALSISNDGGGEVLADEDVLEVPIFVRLEYETEADVGAREKGEEKGSDEDKKEKEKEKRELAYWCAATIGKIAS